MAKKSDLKTSGNNGNSKEQPLTIRQVRQMKAGQESSLWMMLPGIVFAAVVILLVHCVYYHMPMSQFSWTSWSDTEMLSDFFTRTKMTVIVCCAVLSILMLVYKFTVAELAIKPSKIYIPMAVYAAFVLASYFASEYKDFALWGWTERFEGTITLLAYMVMLFFIYNTVNNEKNARQLMTAVIISSIVLSLIGLTQILDHDFFKTVFGQKIIVSNELLSNGYKYWEYIDKCAAEGTYAMNFNMPAHTVYQTVFNINYVSFYLSMLLPIFSMMFVQVMQKDANEPLWKKILLGVVNAFCMLNIIGSKSTSGFVGLAVAVVVAVVLLRKRLKDMLKALIILLIIFAIVIACTTSIWTEELGQSVGDVSGNFEATGDLTWDYVETDGGEIHLSINDMPFTVGIFQNEEGLFGIYAYDPSGQLDLVGGEEDVLKTFYFADKKYADLLELHFGSNELGYLELDLVIGGEPYTFIIAADGIFYITKFGRSAPLQRVEHSLFSSNTSFASGRGYIWSRSIPLLKENIVLGSGADTFCIVFPQNDIAGRFTSGWWTDGTIIDKPHNMYLGTAIGTGCVSLIALLFIFGLYIVQSFKLLWKREFGSDFLTYLSSGLLFGVIGFMVSGLFNDSSVSTMPLFYSMLGLGMAVNYMLKRRDEAEN